MPVGAPGRNHLAVGCSSVRPRSAQSRSIVRTSVLRVNNSLDVPDHAQEPLPSASPATVAIDLDAIEADLRDVEVALNRLADGTYWTDEITGQPIPDDVLVRDPTARHV
jgi:RNA polymerase-binding transcription factor DksA